MPKLSNRLTDRVVAQAVHRDKRYELGDGGSGLVLRVEPKPSRTKTWQIRYRNEGGLQRNKNLGRYPDMGLSDARAAAMENRAQIKRGIDVVAAEKAEHLAAASEPLVYDLIDQFIHRHLPGLSSSTANDYLRYLERDVRGVLGKKRVSEVRRKDISMLVQEVADRARDKGGSGVAGAMLRRVLSKLFASAVAWGYIDANPVAGTAPPAKSKRRETRLAISRADGGRAVVGQIGNFLAAVEASQKHPETKAIIKLCLMLGLRVREAAEARVEHLNLNEELLFVQGKGGKERTLPLPVPAIKVFEEQLHQLRDQGVSSDFIFPQKNNPSKPVGWSGVSHAVSEIAELADMEGLTTHDLRRTAATGLRELGVSRDVIEKILGHSSSDVTSIYVRTPLKNEVRRALEKWCDYVCGQLPVDS